ncbi:hypothetical protein DXA62_11605 [Coprobacillus sp. OF03-2AA]|nr:hypothetical protein DXA62_11605 [Coprobacillus sp. OF03-2AA]
MKNKYFTNFISYDEIKKNKKEVSNIFHPTIPSPVSTTKNIFVSNNPYREIKDWDKYIGNNKEN